MIVVTAEVTIHAPAAHSLKDKRRLLRSLLQRLHNRYPIAVAETGRQDEHAFAEIGLAVVSGQARHAEEVLHEALRELEKAAESFSAEVIEVHVERR